MAKRIGNFIIFLLLSVVTFGMYPLFFMVTLTKERNELLAGILAEAQK
jgi:hypothetical protein